MGLTCLRKDTKYDEDANWGIEVRWIFFFFMVIRCKAQIPFNILIQTLLKRRLYNCKNAFFCTFLLCFMLPTLHI